MIADFVVNVAASLVSSGIIGFFTNKVLGKNSNDIFVKIYTVYVCFCTFITSLLFAYTINSDIVRLLVEMSEANIFTIYKYTTISFVFMFLQFTIVTVIFLTFKQLESTRKSMDKLSKNCQIK